MDQSKQSIIIFSASSRQNGHTNQVMTRVSKELNAGLIDLGRKNISYYDYEHHNEGDDFMLLAEQMTQASVIIVATPVYWYTMSAQLKTFFDRWSDLVTVRKDLGRALRGKTLMLVSCGSGPHEVPGFEIPVKETAGYMNMHYGGYFPTWVEDEEEFGNEIVQNRVNLLVDLIKQKLEIK